MTQFLFFALGVVVGLFAYALAFISIIKMEDKFKEKEHKQPVVHFNDLPKIPEEIGSRRESPFEKRIADLERRSHMLVDDMYAHFIILESLIDVMSKEQLKDYIYFRDKAIRTAFKGDLEQVRKFTQEHVILRKGIVE